MVCKLCRMKSRHTILPDIDLHIGLMQALFTLEERYGLVIDEADGEVCLKVNVRANKVTAQLHEMLCAWRQAAAMLKAGEITKEEYDRWRYHYPEYDTSQKWAKVTSQALSDMLVDALKEDDNETKKELTDLIKISWLFFYE